VAISSQGALEHPLYLQPDVVILASKRGVLVYPKSYSQDNKQRGQHHTRDHKDLDSQFAHGRDVVVDIWIAVKESVTVAKNIRAA
jgi:hypothetical protein